MTPADVFAIVNPTALVMWIMMVFLPKWKGTKFLLDYKVVPILLSVVYVIYIAKSLIAGGMMDFGSLASVKELFTVDNAVLAGWVHYLAFDLIVGMWILEQNKKANIHHLLIVPCLLGTFMFGPVGFLLFILIQSIKK